jgi:hypothetical protein
MEMTLDTPYKKALCARAMKEHDNNVLLPFAVMAIHV